MNSGGASPDQPGLARTIRLAHSEVPRFFYGTAWKEQETARLTTLAIEQGFRAIDSANQRRSYDEAGVGLGVRAALAASLATRDELFLQSKFTFRPGHDHRVPYDVNAALPEQVAQSFASTLDNLSRDYLDSYLLHGPILRGRLTSPDWVAWRAMEQLYDQGVVRMLGISNIDRTQLEQLCEQARVAPRVVQNRCDAATGWDASVREFCGRHGILYQGFGLLKLRREFLLHPALSEIARRENRSISQIILRFLMDVGAVPLVGASSAEHMQANLAVFDFQLNPDDIARIERLAAN